MLMDVCLKKGQIEGLYRSLSKFRSLHLQTLSLLSSETVARCVPVVSTDEHRMAPDFSRGSRLDGSKAVVEAKGLPVLADTRI